MGFRTYLKGVRPAERPSQETLLWVIAAVSAMIFMIWEIGFVRSLGDHAWEPWLERHEKLSSLVSGLAIILAAVRYISSRTEINAAERRASHYRAWQTINSAAGQSGNAGRFDALMELAADGVSLRGINLDGAWLNDIKLPPRSRLSYASFRPAGGIVANLNGAVLREVSLERADLESAYLIDARLEGANLSGARLKRVRLEGAKLEDAALEDADLSDAKLGGAELNKCSLSRAILDGADLTQAQLQYATLRGASLRNTDLTGADLYDADLSAADLSGALLGSASLNDGTRLKGTNIYGARGVTEALRQWALQRGAIEEVRAPNKAQ